MSNVLSCPKWHAKPPLCFSFNKFSLIEHFGMHNSLPFSNNPSYIMYSNHGLLSLLTGFWHILPWNLHHYYRTLSNYQILRHLLRIPAKSILFFSKNIYFNRLATCMFDEKSKILKKFYPFNMILTQLCLFCYKQ